MEDVDEGFGSNESNLSPTQPKTSILIKEIKHLNGQSVIGENGSLTFNGKYNNLTRDVNSSLGGAQESAGEEVKYETGNINAGDGEESEINKSCCTEFKDVFRDQNDISEENGTSSEEENNGVGNGHRNGIVTNVVVSRVKPETGDLECNTNGKAVKENSSKTLVTNNDKLTEDSDSKHSDGFINENSSTKDSEASHLETLKHSEKIEDHDSFEHIDKIKDSNEINLTPVKQKITTRGAKSPFFLDDKVRNSLKGLVNKVKSSELFRDSPSPVEVEDDSPSQMEAENTNESEEGAASSSEETQDESVQASEGTNDESILEGNEEDGISMEIGSDDEELLLDLEPSEPNTTAEKSEDTERQKREESASSNLSETSREKDGNPSDHTDRTFDSPIEITSDNDEDEDTALMPDTGKTSSELVQFESDSNSNFESGNAKKISEIVNFLNHDISASNSPSPINAGINGAKPDKNGQNVFPKETKVIELIESTEDTSNSVTSKSNSLDGNDKSLETTSESKTVDSKANVNSKELEESALKQNLEIEKSELGETQGENENMDTVNNEDSDESDDDVIFEGETKANSKENEPVLKKQEIAPEVTDVCVQYGESESQPIETTESNNKSEEIEKDSKTASVSNDAQEDDDVIFQKETKIDAASKHNCDNLESKTEVADVQSQKTESLPAESAINNSNDIKDCAENTPLSPQMPGKRDSSDRKRSAEEKEISEQEAKRSKLDLSGLIGKLGSRVEPASIELSDTEDEEMTSESTDTAEERGSAVVADDRKQKEKLITLTEKELDALVREKVKAYLATQRDTLIAKLSQKVKDLQLNNDLWKRQVKDLQVKVNDVTVLQQKLEKRKAATAALRQITTRNVAVQVEDGRTASTRLKTRTSPHKAPLPPAVPPPPPMPLIQSPGSNGTIRLPIPQSSLPTSVIASSMQQGVKIMTSAYQTPSVKSLLDTTRVQKTIGSVAQTTTTVTSVLGLLHTPTTVVPKPPVAQGSSQQAMTNLIATNVSKTPTKTVVLTSPTSKIIDLTEDDESTKARLVTLPPGINTITNQGIRHVLAQPGTQLVQSGPNQPTYRLLFNPTPNSGVMMTVQSPVTKTTTLLQSTVPKTTGLLQTIPPPQNVVNLTSPPAATSVPPVVKAQTVAVPKIHPAPFPDLPANQPTVGFKALPPKPSLKISPVSQGIVLSWNMVITESVAEISNYQLFAYQETSAPPTSSLWKKVGDVKALPLPMACTLTQFQAGNKYHFAVRAMDIHNRVGNFSDPSSIHLTAGPQVK